MDQTMKVNRCLGCDEVLPFEIPGRKICDKCIKNAVNTVINKRRIKGENNGN